MTSLRYQPTRQDLLDACRLHDLGVAFGWRRLALAAAYTVGVMVLLSALLSLTFRPIAAGLLATLAALIITGTLLALRYALLPRHLVRRLLKERRTPLGELTLTWSERGYAAQGETGASDMAWAHYVRWREDARVILLYQTWQSYHFVPKRVLPPGAATFMAAQLRAAGVQKAPTILS